MTRRTVVIGGQGFLGGAVVRELLRRGDVVTVMDRVGSQDTCDALFGPASVTAIQGDIGDMESLRPLCRGVDEVYQFGGRLGTSELEEDIPAAIHANVTGAVNVFEAALAGDVGVVFHPSKPNVWLNTYTITKVAAEQFALLYRERGLNVLSLRFFNAYGPRQALGPIRKIIPTFARYAIRGEPIPVYGDGEQTVDMIYSEDIGRITVDFVRHGGLPEPVDLGRGVPMTVNEVAHAVNACVGSEAGVVHLPMRRGETPDTKLVADVAPLRSLLGTLTFADWDRSLATTVEWYETLLTEAAPRAVPHA